MASLMDNMISVLNKENEEYQILIGLSREKIPILIKGDLDALAKITAQEQDVVARIQKLEKERMQISKDIANVTNQSVEDMKLAALIDMMKTRPVEHEKLVRIHDELKQTMDNMVAVNNQNKELIKNSLEMVEFEINLLQSMKRAPETNDYDKSAYSTGNIMGSGTKRFDAKQ
ncbi:MAG: flagellar protein FlgN [Lachnospiraceae bacterium]